MMYPIITALLLVLSGNLLLALEDIEPVDHKKIRKHNVQDTTNLSTCVWTQLEEEEKQEILYLHNMIRDNVAQTSASNMLRLHWNSDLEAKAVRWVKWCSSRPRCVNGPYYIKGKNVAWPSHGGIEEQMTLWFSEAKRFNSSGVNSYAFDPRSSRYTQLVWATTNCVGCAKANCKGMDFPGFIMVCYYHPIGNVVGASVYKRGAPGTSCPSGYKSSLQANNLEFSALCESRRNLCSISHVASSGWSTLRPAGRLSLRAAVLSSPMQLQMAMLLAVGALAANGLRILRFLTAT